MHVTETFIYDLFLSNLGPTFGYNNRYNNSGRLGKLVV